MAQRVVGLTGATLETAPGVCHECVWWQSRNSRSVAKDRWIERAEENWGAWGALYRDDDGKLLGSIQYGPAQLFPRSAELPAGPASDDAVLVTCVYLVSSSTPWVEQSLFLAAIGEARDKGAGALEQLSKMLSDAAGQVDDKLGGQYGQYARSAADQVQGLADTVRNKDVDELMADVRGFVKASPAVAIGVAAALGFAVTRLAQAGRDAPATPANDDQGGRG